jgi:ABC-type uncharacterized transport system permease subunit
LNRARDSHSASEPRGLLESRDLSDSRARTGWSHAGDWAVRSIGPIIIALLVGALILAILGRNPLAFYSDLFRTGLVSSNGWQAMLTRLAPLLLIGMGLIVAFRAGLWNIGGDGQFLLAAAVVAGLTPAVMSGLSRPAGLIVLGLIGFVVGGVWTILPAYLKAWFGVNEIITSVMMSFIGVNLANLLIKEVWRTETTTVPQTDSVPLAELLPRLGGTTIHVGIVVAVVTVVIVWYLVTRTAVGLRLTVLGASPRAAVHAGLHVKRLIVGAFFVSGALIGLAAAVEILGVWGYMRADWNPKFGLALFALVFLARLNPAAVLPLTAFYAVLDIGGYEAARRADLDHDFVLILIGLILLFMAVSEYLRVSSERRSRRTHEPVDALPPGTGP